MSSYVNFNSIGGAQVKAVIYEGTGPVDLTIKMGERATGVSIHKGDAVHMSLMILYSAGMISAKQLETLKAKLAAWEWKVDNG